LNEHISSKSDSILIESFVTKLPREYASLASVKENVLFANEIEGKSLVATKSFHHLNE